MQYETYPSLEAAQQVVEYATISPDAAVEQVAGIRRRSFLRWKDSATDLLAFMYSGLTEAQPGVFRTTRFIFVFEGHGSPAEDLPLGAPAAQHGTFALPDSRQAAWALGTPRAGWKNPEQPWVAWRAKRNDISYRVEAIGFRLEATQRIARLMAAVEP